MTPAHLSAIWQWGGLLILATLFDVWSATQGGPALFGSAILAAQNRALLLIFAILLISILVILLGTVARAYMLHRDVAGGLWHQRLPRAFFQDLDTRDPMARRFLMVFMLAVMVLPLAGLGHFWFELAEQSVRCDATGNTPHALSLIAWENLAVSDPCRIFDPSALDPQGNLTDDGVTWFPSLQPMLMGLLSLAAGLSVVRMIATLYRP